MFIEWQDSLSIGVPEIDAEHKYLVALVNNIYKDFTSNRLKDNLSTAFVHLSKYVQKHFVNEEALMVAAKYPDLKAHCLLHEDLTFELCDLTEEYIEGKRDISQDTMDYLKAWIVNHVMSQDKDIGNYLDKAGVPVNWDYSPAYTEEAGVHFKMCSCCGKTWSSVEDLVIDNDKTSLGCILDKSNPLFNLIMFNCSCGTTLTIQLTDLIEALDLPFYFSENETSEANPGYCLKGQKAVDTVCPSKCACSYTQDVLKLLQSTTADDGKAVIS